MRAKPQPGTPSYSQGWAPAVGFTDRGKVDQVARSQGRLGRLRGRSGDRRGERRRKDAQQLKHYAREVGNIRVGWKGAGEKTRRRSS